MRTKALWAALPIFIVLIITLSSCGTAQSQDENIFTLSYHDNVDDADIDMPADVSQAGQDSVTFQITEEMPERDGYDFIGWNTSPEGEGEAVIVGDVFETQEKHTDLYAQWLEH